MVHVLYKNRCRVVQRTICRQKCVRAYFVAKRTDIKTPNETCPHLVSSVTLPYALAFAIHEDNRLKTTFSRMIKVSIT